MGRAEARDLGLEEFGPLYDPTVNYRRVRNVIWDWAQDPDPVTQSTRTVDIPPQGSDISLQGPGLIGIDPAGPPPLPGNE
jgi:outer membrane protein